MRNNSSKPPGEATKIHTAQAIIGGQNREEWMKEHGQNGNGFSNKP